MSDKIFVIGDSHCNFFGGYENLYYPNTIIFNKQPVDIRTNNSLIANFQIFHLGPVLAYNLNRYNSKTHGREKVEFLLNSGIIPAGTNIMCAFGEIDMRVHALKQAALKGISFETVVEEILEHYTEFLTFLSRRNTVYVWGAIPTQSDGSPVNPEYPYFGTERDRNIATKYFNDRLGEWCARNGISFFTVFYSLVDEDYKTRAEFIADGCHLSQRAWLFAADAFAGAGITINFTSNWLKLFIAQAVKMQLAINKVQDFVQKWGGFEIFILMRLFSRSFIRR